MTDRLYRYAWLNNSKRATLYGRTCTVLVRGAFNSALIQFTDNGERTVTSRSALRKVKR